MTRDRLPDAFRRWILALGEGLLWDVREELFAESLADPDAEHHDAVRGLLQRVS